ncbi:MAG: hypothetical protein LUF04_15385, partial [Bacteroides sp.]|nr:hypothetical protein [Bacteroides sp.]
YLSENKEGLEYWSTTLRSRFCIGMQKVIIKPIEGILLGVDDRIFELPGLEDILVEEDAKDYFLVVNLRQGLLL